MKTRKQNRKRNRKRERRESWNKEGAAGCLVAADSSSLPALSLCSLSSTTSDSLSLSRPLSISSASAPTPSACSVSASTPPSHSRRAGIFRGVSARCGRHIKALQGAETSRKHGGNPLQEGLLEHRRSVRLLSLFLFFCCVRSLWIPLTASAPARESKGGGVRAYGPFHALAAPPPPSAFSCYSYNNLPPSPHHFFLACSLSHPFASSSPTRSTQRNHVARL